MLYLIVILIVIASILLILAVLIQNPKGGGLGAGFGNMGNQVMGARRATDFIEKFTWGAVAAVLVFTLSTGLILKKATSKAQPESEIDAKLKENSAGAAPTAAPGQQPAAGPQQQPAQQPAAQPQGGGK